MQRKKKTQTEGQKVNDYLLKKSAYLSFLFIAYASRKSFSTPLDASCIFLNKSFSLKEYFLKYAG